MERRLQGVFDMEALLLLVMLISVLLYFAPWLIGLNREVNTCMGLFFVNLLLGWSIIGWVGCLLWAVCGQTRAQDAYWHRVS